MTPAQVRRRGAARRRHQVLAGVVAVLVALVGAGYALAPTPQGGPGLPATVSPSAADRSTPAPPTGSPSEPLSPSPSHPTSAATTAIPDELLLRSADLGGAQLEESSFEYWRDDGRIPPRPCAGDGYPSDAHRAADRLVQATTGQLATGLNVVVEYVAVYNANGAQAFMTELRVALTRCPGQGTVASPTWTGQGPVNVGDDSLLIRHRRFGGYDGNPGTRTDGYLAVVRTGRVILVLASVGWETSSGDAATARTLATVAADRLRPLA
jgi:hypothetical protein